MEKTSRRTFLKRGVTFWAVLAAFPLVKVILEYISPKADIAEKSFSLTSPIASIGDIPAGSAKIFKVGKDPVIVVHSSSGQYSAFGARCTHLGCVVQYEPAGMPHFACNCHGSRFDISGKNIAGPAPRPLTPFRVVIQGSSLFLREA